MAISLVSAIDDPSDVLATDGLPRLGREQARKAHRKDWALARFR